MCPANGGTLKQIPGHRLNIKQLTLPIRLTLHPHRISSQHPHTPNRHGNVALHKRGCRGFGASVAG